jgi:serine/threonine protein phosphatase PrpC
MRFAARSHVGLVRKVNQDRYLGEVDRTGTGVLIVADGMGGAVAGEVASALAVQIIGQTLLSEQATADPETRLIASIESANAKIYEESTTVQEYSGMGTTVVAVLAHVNQLWIAHVGDSRAYMFRPGQGIMQLTEDHSYVNELVRRGQIMPDDALTHPQRHVLMRTLGTVPNVPVDCSLMEWVQGDILLVCSDGLSGYVVEDQYLQILTADGSLADRADRLVEAALAAGGVDNVTVALLEHDGDAKWRPLI